MFKRHKRSIRQLISPRHVHTKELIQTIGLDHYLVSATRAEQYITLEIPQDFINHWIDEGYSHLYFGAIRLILNFHGRQNILATARMSLLKKTFMIYEHAVIGSTTVTLNSGSVLLTFYPNFNMLFRDLNLSFVLHIQIQIHGAPQVGTAFAGTIQHHLVYRLQDHAINLCLPVQDKGPIFVCADQPHILSIVQFPPAFCIEELLKRMSSTWLTNYEKLQKQIHKAPVILYALVFSFQRLSDGTI